MVETWISRDTRSLIRAVGGDDQSGETIQLGTVLVPMIQIGQAYEVFPQPGLPSSIVSVTSPAVVGRTASVIIRPIGQEVVVWSIDPQTGAGFVIGSIYPVTNIVVMAGTVISTPTIPIYQLPTWQIETGNTAGIPANTLRASALTALINARGWNRIPRGHVLQLFHSALNTSFSVDLMASDTSAISVPG